MLGRRFSYNLPNISNPEFVIQLEFPEEQYRKFVHYCATLQVDTGKESIVDVIYMFIEEAYKKTEEQL